MTATEDSRAIRGEGTTEAEWNGWPALRHQQRVTAETLVAAGGRAVVVAPHPDDEVLAFGGCLVQLARLGRPIRVIAVTDGTASHRGSGIWTVERLASERPRESRQALQQLGVNAEPLRLGLPDGALHAVEGFLARRLLPLLQAGDVIFTTWRGDGHPDHEATGRACAWAAVRTGARLVEAPVWAWHWSAPDDPRLPWRRARRLMLEADTVARKCAAVRSFRSQLEPDASTGNGPILRATTIERAARPFETVFL